MLELYAILKIPGDFATERVRSVSHSFEHGSDEHGSCSWFHFLSKNIDVKQEGTQAPEVHNRAAAMGNMKSRLPQADYSYHRSGFFLRVDSEDDVTLVCFGATSRVRKRLADFIAAKAWGDVATEPYVLFDLVLDGLYAQVDDTVWNMNTVFGDRFNT